MISIADILENREKYNGLTSAQAEKQLAKFGYNKRERVKSKSWLKRLWSIFTEPMMLLIIIAAVVYYFIGELAETILFLSAIIPIGLMEFFQESRTDKAIEELDKIMQEHASVLRNKKIKTLDVGEIVPYDLVYLTAGDKIPADGLVLRSPGISIDESILTGESVPVVKEQLPDNYIIGENNEIKKKFLLFQGTLVVQGEGYLLVQKTGEKTAYGSLGKLLSNIKTQKTPLQKKIRKLVRQIAVVAISSSVLVTVILFFTKGPKEGILGGLTMAMSLVPEEFPVVFSVFLIMGVWRMSKKNALVRQMAMVETLGSATVICTDKTGTLTEGRMSLEKIYYQGKVFDTDNILKTKKDFNDLIKCSLLSFEKVAIDPLEIEVQNFAKKLKINQDEFYSKYSLLKDSSFSSKSKMVHHVWKNRETNKCGQYSAGAPESIIKACKISATEEKKVVATYENMAAQGYRVVAVAKKAVDCQSEITTKDMSLIGLLAMSDPPRDSAAEAVQICQEAGIRIIMITGDNKLTAHNIAESIGLRHNEEIISGEELEKLSPSAWQETVRRHDIFARIAPEQKYSIVQALQANGEMVAMTGDGVNDAPALKKANIGIAMGIQGTQVARAAAGIILLDDNFASIVSAVKEGRRIYDNLRQSFSFLFTFHIPIIGLAILPILFNQSLIFLPIHVIFLELICDPASVLGFEREKARRGLMKEKPRAQQEPLIINKVWGRVLVQGLVILLISLGFYYYFGILQNNMYLGRTLAFSSLVISQVMLIIFSREYEQVKSNKLLLLIAILTLIVLTLVIYIPFFNNLFHFQPITSYQYLLVLLISPLAMAGLGQVFRRK